MMRNRPGTCEHEQTGDEQHRLQHLEADQRKDELTDAIAWLVQHGQKPTPPGEKPPVE